MKKFETKDFGFVFWTHLIIIILVYLSPWLVSWKVILVFIGLYYLQLLIIGDCWLTRKQFNTTKRGATFYYYYLTKLGFNFEQAKVRKVVDYYIPWIILAVALVWQEVLGRAVYFNF